MTIVKVSWPVQLGADLVTADLLYGQSLDVQNGSIVGDPTFMTLADVVLKFEAGNPFPAEVGNIQAVQCTTMLHGVEFTLQIECERKSDDQAIFSTGQLTLPVPPGKLILGVTTEVAQGTLTIGATPWSLKIASTDGKAIATSKVFGVTFRLDQLELDASGFKNTTAEAMLDSAIKIPKLSDVSLLAANAAWSGFQRSAMLRISFAIPDLAGSKAEIELHATNSDVDAEWRLTSKTTLNTNTVWSDPSGWVTFDHMGLDIKLASAAGGEQIEASNIMASGRMTFTSGRLSGAANEWLSGLFSGLTSEFRDVDIFANGPDFSLEFSPPGGLTLNALGILQLDIATIKLSKTGIDLQSISLRVRNLFGADLRGAIDAISIVLDGAPSIDFDKVSIEVALSAPGGVKANAKIKYEHSDVRQVLLGAGQLSTPTFPGVEVTFRIGRFCLGNAWVPTVFVYAATPACIPLFPGVVVRNIALGLGINVELQDTSRLSLAAARKKLESGLPDASRPENWHDSSSSLTLVARAMVASSQGPNDRIPEFYVADLTLIATSDFQITAIGKVWLQTSVYDASTPDFQKQPFAAAMALLDGQEPSLRIVAQTYADSKNSIGASGIAGHLLGSGLPPTRFAMEATSTSLAIVVGPNTISGALGPLQISGSSQLAFRAARGRVYLISQSNLAASFNTSASVSFGPVTMWAGVNFGFSADLALLGQFRAGRLLIYGRAVVLARAGVDLRVRISFEIRIGKLFGRDIRISWSQEWSFNLQIHADLELEVAVTSEGELGMRGQATLSVNVIGIQASISVPAQFHVQVVDDARHEADAVRKDIEALIGQHMSDLLFFKRLSDTIWLGLRSPVNLKVQIGASKPEISSDWKYEATPWPVEALTAHFVGLDYVEQAGVKALQFVWREISCKANPEGLPLPYSGLDSVSWQLKDLQTFIGNDSLTELEAAKQRLAGFIEEHRRSPTAPLNLPIIYRSTNEDVLRENADNKKVLVPDALVFASILGMDQPVPIEMLSGLLFFLTMETGAAVPSGAQVVADPFIASMVGRNPVTLVPTQRVDRIDFRLSVYGVLQSNIDVLRLIAGHSDNLGALDLGPDESARRKTQLDDTALRFSPSFSASRTLGFMPSKLRRRNLVEIPTKPPTAGPDVAVNRDLRSDSDKVRLAELDQSNWETRNFQFSDTVAPELTGELLNYGVEFFNPHGRCTHYARLVIVRRDLSAPVAPSRGAAQLIVETDTGVPITCQLSLVVPNSASTVGAGGGIVLRQARAVLYAMDCELVPTGFYGDADDAALAIARIYSDLDPAALFGAEATQLAPASDQLVEIYPARRLSTQGLREIGNVTFVYQGPAATLDAANPPDAGIWSAAIQWEALMRPAQPAWGVMLYAALRRQYDDTWTEQERECPESPLIQLKLEIGVQLDEGPPLPVSEVQHFESFWKLPRALGALELEHARVSVLPNVEASLKGLPAPAQVRVTIDHKAVINKLGPAAEARMAVGGYRIWLRERRSSGYSWECVSILQAVPPLVKAFAPVEGGRLWSLKGSPGTAGSADRPAWLDAPPKDIYVKDIPKVSGSSATLVGKALTAMPSDGTSLLREVQRLVGAGNACEVLLSVSARRQLENDEKGQHLPLAKWVLLRDQNNRWLGKAYVMWGPDAVKLDVRCELTERPGAYDTLGIDDFGRISWTWTGLSDLWNHDLEWVVEKLSRSAPIMQSLARMKNDRSTAQDRFLHSDAAVVAESKEPFAPSVPSALEDHPRHNVTVSRREPKLVGKFQLIQAIGDTRDAFVFRVVAPPEVVQSSHSALVRTGRGVYAFTAIGTQRQFRWTTDFLGDLPLTLVKAWCTGNWIRQGEWKEPSTHFDISSIAAPLPGSGHIGDYGELEIDEPSCLMIGIQTFMTVDNLTSMESFELRDVVRPSPPLPAVTDFAKGGRLQEDIPTLHNFTLFVPLARLEWGYQGAASPSTKLAFDKGPLNSLNLPLMRLPDPRAYAIVFEKKGATFVPIARFYGQQLTPPTKEVTGLAPVSIQWGCLFASADLTAGMPVVDGFDCGQLRLVFTVVDSDNLRVQWWRDGSSLLLSPNQGV